MFIDEKWDKMRENLDMNGNKIVNEANLNKINFNKEDFNKSVSSMRESISKNNDYSKIWALI